MSGRERRSAAPTTVSVPGYGPRASIPATGFIFDPEDLIRESRRNQIQYETPDIVNDEAIARQCFIDDTKLLVVKLALAWLDLAAKSHHSTSPRTTPEPLHLSLSTHTTPERESTYDIQLHQSPPVARMPAMGAATTSTAPVEPSNSEHEFTGDTEGENERQTTPIGEHSPSPVIGNEHENDDGDEDDASSDSEHGDSDDDDDEFGSFWRIPTSNIIIRPALETEGWTISFNERLKDSLSAFLSSHLSFFFTTLVVISERFSDPQRPPYEIPIITIVYNPTTDSTFPPLEEWTATTDTDEYIIMVAEGERDFLSNYINFPFNQQFQMHPRTGASIAAKHNGTVGLFMKTDDDKYFGFSCAHVLGKESSRRHVQQPWSKDFLRHLKFLEQSISTEKEMLKSTNNQITRFTITEEIDSLQASLDEILPLKASSDGDLRKNLSFGRVVKSEFDIIEYEGRRCMADWGVFRVGRLREPSEERVLEPRPEQGALSEVEWQRANGFGELRFDSFVRKSGRTTGLTYGFIGGLYGEFKPGGFENQSSSEYWAMEEKGHVKNIFADHGDSGASVVDNEGKIVGFVFAHVAILSVKVIVDQKSRIPNISKIAERRRDDGTVDIEDEFTQVFSGQTFVLIESAEMVMERCKLEGEIVENLW